MNSSKLKRQSALPVTRVRALAFASPGIFLGLLVAVLVLQVARLIEASDWVDHTDQVIARINVLEKQTLDLETGMRGFLLTRRASFLEPYESALPKIESSLENVKALVLDDPAQVGRLDSVSDDLGKWIAFSKSLIRMTRAGGNPVPVMASEPGKRIIDHMQSTMSDFIDAETQLRDVRGSAVKRSSWSVTIVSGMLFLIVAALISWLLRSRRRWEEKLLASEERFRVLISGVRDYAIYMIDLSGRVVSWNEGAERLKGYSAEEILGKDYSAFFTSDARMANEPSQSMQEAAEKGAVHREGWRVRKDGSRFWAEVLLTPLFRSNGQLFGFAKITRDLTDQKRHQNELTDALQRAQDAVRAREDTLAIVSHDLKNPLLSILLSMELEQSMTHQQSLDPEQMKTLRKLGENVRRSASQANQLIQDLLNWARIDSGNLSVELKAVRILELIDEVVGSLSAIAGEKEIRLASESSESITSECVVSCDRGRILQVLMNLVGNAIKFTQRGGEVRIRLNQDNETGVEVLVQDNGAGISPSALAHIFERYWQPEETKRQGTGLGLFIAKGIVDAHGGRIWVRSVLGQGSTFGFSLKKAS